MFGTICCVLMIIEVGVIVDQICRDTDETEK